MECKKRKRSKVGIVGAAAVGSKSLKREQEQTKEDDHPVLVTSLGTVLHKEYVVPFSNLPDKWRKSLWFKRLTVVPQKPKIGKTEVEPFDMYHETLSELCVPKFLGLHWFGRPSRDERSVGEPLPDGFQFKGDLINTCDRPQQVAHDKCIEQLHHMGGALLVLPCGFGKTVVSLAIANTLKRRTLVIVTAVELARQWVERIEQFCGCDTGWIQGDTCDTDKPFVIAMLQTLLRRQPDLSMFGTCIVDEAHHVAAHSFSQVMPLVPSRYILGLSATPNRKDGLKKVLLWTLGPIAFKAERSDGQGPNVMQCVVTDGMKQVVTYKSGDVGQSKMITLLTKDAVRNNFIVHMLNQVLSKNPERKVLMLTDRREQANWMLDTFVEQDRWATGLMLGGMKEQDIEQQKQAQVLISTYHYCSEGFDLPRLDTLFLLSPRSDVEQTVGRILRAHPEKQKPLIMDFVDNFSVFESQAVKRERYYKKLQCTLKKYDQSQLVQVK